MRSAIMYGLWYGTEITPVPKRIRWVTAAACAMNTSGEAMISKPDEWCSPTHTSS